MCYFSYIFFGVIDEVVGRDVQQAVAELDEIAVDLAIDAGDRLRFRPPT